VDIPLKSSHNVLTLPVQAVQVSGENRGHVLLLGSDNKLQERDVTLGAESGTDVEIVTGLADNDTVVFGEQSQYRPNELVKPKFIIAAGME
jgi:multidrug efflux pump subunit AcrA (membrane-fusion protein)